MEESTTSTSWPSLPSVPTATREPAGERAARVSFGTARDQPGVPGFSVRASSSVSFDPFPAGTTATTRAAGGAAETS